MTNPILQISPRYQLSETPSSMGGFSDVFFYEDLHLERVVAIKTIKEVLEINRLRDEINALMQLRSKHVVQIYDITPEVDNIFGIVMEYIEGPDLFNIPEESKTPENLLKILWQIAVGINDIHQAGIIHRDIKPNNIKIDNEGVVKIFDFGLARNQDQAYTVGFKGTCGFAAPEQFQYNEIEFTSAIDVYAFGATALYLITRELPNELRNIPPSPLLSGAFENTFLNKYTDLISLFEKCLSHDINKRPTMAFITEQLSKNLLYNKHQALVIYNDEPHVLNNRRQKVKLNVPTMASCELIYNGFEFQMVNVSGEVYVNNILITNDHELHGACVISLGNASRHWSERKYITFDISYPEVTL